VNPPGFARFLALCATSVPNLGDFVFMMLDAGRSGPHLGVSNMNNGRWAAVQRPAASGRGPYRCSGMHLREELP